MSAASVSSLVRDLLVSTCLQDASEAHVCAVVTQAGCCFENAAGGQATASCSDVNASSLQL